MDQDTYEQTSLARDLIGEGIVFLHEGMIVTIESHEGEPLGVSLPDTAVQTVTETEPVVRGQTAAASYKPALLDNGVRLMVPPHISEGERVVISTADSTYVERARD